MTHMLEPIHPGEILLEEFMRPLGLSQNKLAQALGVNPGRVNEIVRGRRGITADTALRLATFFSTTAELSLNLQSNYDLKRVSRDQGPAIRKTVKPHKVAA
jgi:antitoxin HigA-1